MFKISYLIDTAGLRREFGDSFKEIFKSESLMAPGCPVISKGWFSGYDHSSRVSGFYAENVTDELHRRFLCYADIRNWQCKSLTEIIPRVENREDALVVCGLKHANLCTWDDEEALHKWEVCSSVPYNPVCLGTEGDSVRRTVTVPSAVKVGLTITGVLLIVVLVLHHTGLLSRWASKLASWDKTPEWLVELLRRYALRGNLNHRRLSDGVLFGLDGEFDFVTLDRLWLKLNRGCVVYDDLGVHSVTDFDIGHFLVIEYDGMLCQVLGVLPDPLDEAVRLAVWTAQGVSREIKLVEKAHDSRRIP